MDLPLATVWRTTIRNGDPEESIHRCRDLGLQGVEATGETNIDPCVKPFLVKVINVRTSVTTDSYRNSNFVYLMYFGKYCIFRLTTGQETPSPIVKLYVLLSLCNYVIILYRNYHSNEFIHVTAIFRLLKNSTTVPTRILS